MATVKQTTTKSGQIVYDVAVKDGAGHRIMKRWKPKPGISQKNADRQAWAFADKLERDFKEGKVQNRAEKKAAEEAEARILSVRKYADEIYLPQLAIHAAPTSVDGYKRACKLTIYPAIGDIKITDVTHQQINSMLQEYQASGKAISSVIKLYTVTQGIFKAAFRDEVIMINPMDRVQRPKARKDEIKNSGPEYMTLDLVKDLCSALRKEVEQAEAMPDHAVNERADAKHTEKEIAVRDARQWRLFFLVLIYTGIRRGEAVALQWQDIDFEAKTVRIQRGLEYTKEKGVYETTPKSSRIRDISLTPELIELLKALKKAQASAGILTPWIFNSADTADHLFPTSPTKYFTTFCERNQLPHLWPHLCRHTWATLTYEQTGDILAVSKVLGHADPAVTLRVYSHTSEQAKKKAVDAFAAAIGG